MRGARRAPLPPRSFQLHGGDITTVRKKDVPIVFTVVGYDPKVPGDGGLWPEKAPSLLELKLGSDLVELDPHIRRAPEDLLLIKKYASAFLGTPLSATLVTRGVDTLIVTGCTTSGCVRASVVDALSHGFRPYHPARGGRRSRRGAARG